MQTLAVNRCWTEGFQRQV